MDTLQSLQSLRGGEIEIVLVDGGSNDRTVALATPLVDRIELGRRGRAAQMNIGAALSRGDVLLFLHADTRLPSGFAEQVRQALKSGMHVWGRFDTRICSRSLSLRVVGRMMNIRSRCSGIATGDQAMFVLRADFERAGGFPEIPLMEDIALSKNLKRISWPATITLPVSTSARRWEQNGILRTILLMWYLRWAYYTGADPVSLARKYGYHAAAG